MLVAVGDGGQEALLMLEEVVEREQACALFGPALAEGQQAAEPAVGGAVGGPDQQIGEVGECQAGADDQLGCGAFTGCLFPAFVGADDAGEGVEIGDGDGAIAQFGGPVHQFIRMRSAAEEGEVGGDIQFGVVVLRRWFPAGRGMAGGVWGRRGRAWDQSESRDRGPSCFIALFPHSNFPCRNHFPVSCTRNIQ